MRATEVGLTLGVYGIGMVAGAMLAPRIERLLPLGLTIAIGPLSAVIASLGLLLTLWLPSVALAALSFFLFGAGPIVWTITTTTLRQHLTPEAMLGRVSALLTTATFGARPIGAAIGAMVAVTAGLQVCLIVVALGFVVQFLILALSQVCSLQSVPDRDRQSEIGE